MKKITFLVIVVFLVIAGCTKKAVPTVTKEDLNAGAGLYAANCAKCHGATGVEGRAPNLSQTSASKGDIIQTVAHGQGRMPAFGEKLSEKEIAQVTNFVVSLKK